MTAGTGALRSLLKGVLFSAGGSLFFYFGILAVYDHLPLSVIIPVCFTFISAVFFWISIKHDRMYEVMNIISSTVAFDFMHGQPLFFRIMRAVRPLNVYMPVIFFLLLFLLLSCVLPAVIMYMIIYPEHPAVSLNITSLALSAFICALYCLPGPPPDISVSERGFYIFGCIIGFVILISIV